MDYEHIKQGELPRTWSDILGGFGCWEIKRFPLEGQALTNARHAIPRMGRKGLKFRTRSKGDHFYILCTAHQQDGARLSRKEIQQLFRKFCCEFFDDSGILFRHVVPLARIFRDAEKLRTGRIAQFDRLAVFVALPVARFEVFPFAA